MEAVAAYIPGSKTHTTTFHQIGLDKGSSKARPGQRMSKYALPGGQYFQSMAIVT